MTAIDDSSLWRRDPALPFQAMDEEIIVVDPSTRQVHLLNATAARIWTLLANAQSLPALVATLEEEFDTPTPALRAEVEAFLSEMSEKRLCAPAPSTSAAGAATTASSRPSSSER